MNPKTTDTLEHLTALLGTEAVQKLRDALGGRTVYIPAVPNQRPLALHLECCIAPSADLACITAVLPHALEALRQIGIPVQAVRVEPRGLGQGYLDALGRTLRVPVTALAR